MFNVNNVSGEVSNAFEPLPKGWYDAELEDIELRDGRNQGSQYFSLKYRILGPSHANRVIFGMMTWTNTNQKAVEIGHQQLKALCQALGVEGFSDPRELVGRGAIQIGVTIKKQAGYEDKNEIRAWRKSNGQRLQQKSLAGGGVAPAKAPQPQGWNDDNIPF